MSKKLTNPPSSLPNSQITLKWQRCEKPLPLPLHVREALQKLNEAGHVAYIVGGSVRDFLLNLEVKDHDVATSATPDLLVKLFPLSITDGIQFGVIKIPYGHPAKFLEISTFRKDLDYQNHRHPKGVEFSDPVEDAKRRDFTINALYYDPKTNRILDITGGIEDLGKKTLRAIGNPSNRFREDALRLLRAIRFSTRLGFTIEPETMRAIEARSRLILKISPERIRDELARMWTGNCPDQALSLLAKLGLLNLILPEAEPLHKIPPTQTLETPETFFDHLLKSIQFYHKQNTLRSSTAVWTLILSEMTRATLPAGFQELPPEGELPQLLENAEKILNRLKLGKMEIQKILSFLKNLPKIKEVFRMRESTLLRLIRDPSFDELLGIHRALACASDGNLAPYEFCLSRLEQIRTQGEDPIEKLLDGKDLIQLGFSPGPHFSEILTLVEDLTLEKKLKTKEQALEYVIKNFVK